MYIVPHIHFLDTIRALECNKNSVRVSDISDELGLPRPILLWDLLSFVLHTYRRI